MRQITKSDILKTIEQLRKELNELAAEKKDLLTEEIIKKSEELDKVLNEYLKRPKK